MNVTVTKYNENWILMFQDEARRIKEIFANTLIDIHLITFIPFKPIIR